MSQSDRDTIFGNTYCGVPSPLVPHEHPYPTRYHGPWFGIVSQNSSYRENPYMNPVDPGPGIDLSGCSACSQGFGETAPLFQSATGYSIADAILGGAVAALVSKPTDRIMAGAAGAIVSYFAGTLGLLTVTAGAIYFRMRKSEGV